MDRTLQKAIWQPTPNGHKLGPLPQLWLCLHGQEIRFSLIRACKVCRTRRRSKPASRDSRLITANTAYPSPPWTVTATTKGEPGGSMTDKEFLGTGSRKGKTQNNAVFQYKKGKEPNAIT